MKRIFLLALTFIIMISFGFTGCSKQKEEARQKGHEIAKDLKHPTDKASDVRNTLDKQSSEYDNVDK